ncbi:MULTISPECIES: substrate-binding domain-containing protein [unclassified Mesorhizobium]|jgi:ribose transport system substrate-binding protein|uniref:substrate-binding domain-containing protein n=1 Tax=unclassified Mesorhizobium TaxID=325217 RepID=UPI001128AB26|nr:MULTISPECIES: substrate-binding domain-containing protein [unclassified Mesorhizobium]MBZ9701268.1 substrate-binding domain-containing protein [Mesorhizobium sp. CO1-1-3]MBZ9947920.1 substrate-binding domain-containing protein [Mesorhizobium sp. BR1-1-11]MBZ9957023.1 substrate-binding domain-containing protein [Mesorhizobium sp. BR1-1-14]MBZ9985275.1 substrate-binding domain-containing protein [Mesorhizobium sp. BR-1-1-8]MCA0023302.1 substrate-binding domain-containing protein [Mesorhizobiu
MHYRGFMAAALAVALSGLAASSAIADDTIPPEAKALLEPLPLSPRGQPVPGFPDGPPAVSPDVLKFSDADLAKLKAGKFTAGLVMHTMDAGWPQLQVAGISNTLKDLGIEVVGTTDAKFQPGQQISDLEQMIARKPDVIFSIPIDPKSESEAYKKAAAAGIKLVFMDNVPVDMAPGKDYVSVVASDNEKNAYFAAQELVGAIGGKGEVGIITLVYDYYYSVAARKVGALKAFGEHPDIKVADVGTFTAPEKAYEVATAMLTAHPDMKGIFVAWDTPAQQVVAAAKTLGRDIVITTNDIAADSALNVARGEFLAVGAQRPYDQGVAEAKAAALALLGHDVPPYISVPTLRVKKLDLLSALKQVTKEDAPASVVKICNGECF